MVIHHFYKKPWLKNQTMAQKSNHGSKIKPWLKIYKPLLINHNEMAHNYSNLYKLPENLIFSTESRQSQ